MDTLVSASNLSVFFTITILVNNLHIMKSDNVIENNLEASFVILAMDYVFQLHFS